MISCIFPLTLPLKLECECQLHPTCEDETGTMVQAVVW